MHDIITIRGTVGSDPRVYRSPSGVTVTTFRVASNHRVRDRESGEWSDGTTNWFTVSAFRALGDNAAKSLRKGQRVVVQGRLKIRDWTAGDKHGTSVDLEADTVGHDLAYGTADYVRVYTGLPTGLGDDETVAAGDAEGDVASGSEGADPEAGTAGDWGALGGAEDGADVLAAVFGDVVELADERAEPVAVG
ncbi:single-stranded DNA-binding protein [Agromyces seonyuensis]|uniref:Single-stranded DNA-binding protein n=1 Tax=Agromyces seonyuensis TaxID=2662446 RepID=A0A6I4NWA1_9MICO|nr:single-stranded DNA-binding protein [Agromyces seonyuensis]MWB97372.1 single-stranded DNA-binding protein [Agromyces seonyuensis]